MKTCLDHKWWHFDFKDHCWHDYKQPYQVKHGDGTVTDHVHEWKIKCCWCGKIEDKPCYQ